MGLSGVYPRRIQCRLHDKQRQEQRQPDQDNIGRRALRTKRTAEQREYDDDTRERRHHHQQTWSERQHGEQGGNLD